MSFPIAGRKAGNKLNSVECMIRDALEFVPKEKVLSYLATFPVEVIVGVVIGIHNGCFPVELKEKVRTDFLAENAILVAMKYGEEHPNRVENRVETMLHVAARLLRAERKDFLSFSSSSRDIIRRLMVFNLTNFSEEDKGLFHGLVCDCGKGTNAKTVRHFLDNLSRWVTNGAKQPIARKLLCAGYIADIAEQAFVALENDDLLLGVHAQTPEDEIIESLKIALLAFNVNDKPSVNRAKVLFFSAREFPGLKKAVAAVLEVRPDLAGQFTDDSGRTFGKKAE